MAEGSKGSAMMHREHETETNTARLTIDDGATISQTQVQAQESRTPAEVATPMTWSENVSRAHSRMSSRAEEDDVELQAFASRQTEGNFALREDVPPDGGYGEFTLFPLSSLT